MPRDLTAIIQANVDPDLCRHMKSLGHKKSIKIDGTPALYFSTIFFYGSDMTHQLKTLNLEQ